MGMMETVIFGLIALALAVLALVLCVAKQPVFSGIAGGATIIFVCLSSYNWWLALGDSGKNQRWLGFEQYPATVVVLMALSAVGIYCVMKGANYLAGNRSAKKSRCC